MGNNFYAFAVFLAFAATQGYPTQGYPTQGYPTQQLRYGEALYWQPVEHRRPGYRLMKPLQMKPWWANIAQGVEKVIDQQNNDPYATGSGSGIDFNGSIPPFYGPPGSPTGGMPGPQPPMMPPPPSDSGYQPNWYGNMPPPSANPYAPMPPPQQQPNLFHGPHGEPYPRCINCGDMNGGKIGTPIPGDSGGESESKSDKQPPQQDFGSIIQQLFGGSRRKM